MFAALFAESGLSLDRLRALVEVGASGSIVRAAGNDPVRQSQYSRQLKELEDFFQSSLVERHGKGIRLTAGGKELARISRFFLLGLASFRRGCLAEGQTYRIGASATVISTILSPVLTDPRRTQSGVHFTVEVAAEDDIERRLHDLTLDFGVVKRAELSRPLQVKDLKTWRIRFLVPKALCETAKDAERAFSQKTLPLAWPGRELSLSELPAMLDYEPAFTCDNFLEAWAALEHEGLATFLPDFFAVKNPNRFLELKLPKLKVSEFHFRLAWNPRLLRLNPHARRQRDLLAQALAAVG